MDLARDHVIHSQGGKLGQGRTTLNDLQRIVKQACDAAASSGIVIHFHGGLVNAPAADAIAARLGPLYAQAGAYPMFFKWESGLLETLRNNLRDIKDDSVFQELVKKAAEWVVRKLGTSVVTRGAGSAINKDAFRSQFDEWFAGTANAPPVPIDSGGAGVATRAAAGVPDEDDLAENINAELDDDERFQEVMAGLYLASHRGTAATTRGGNPPAADVQVLVDQRALEEMFPPTTADRTKGILAWIKLARFVARITIAVIKRRRAGRDHGIYTTIVEEVLRSAYLDRVGEVIWRSMKKDTADAFAAQPECVGTALLTALLGQHQPPTRITLVGHSTGAIYINHVIEHAARALPGRVFDIILLAPASRHEDFARVLQDHGTSIRQVRLFAMTDANECNDNLVPIIYPRSLLYLVSGLLEGDVDVPVLGMQRFNENTDVFSGTAFPAVAAVRAWLAADAKRGVWSVDSRANGFGSGALKHGDFDNDPATLESLKWIVGTGF